MIVEGCRQCGGHTHSVQIVKYGKIESNIAIAILLCISPCFLAFVIDRICDKKSLLFKKMFCTNCGL